MRGCVRTRGRIAKPRWRWVRIGHAKRTSEFATWEMRLKKNISKKNNRRPGVYLAFFLLAISEVGCTFLKKYHSDSGLYQRDEDAHAFFCETNARGPEIKNLDRGCGAAGCLAQDRAAVHTAAARKGRRGWRHAAGIPWCRLLRQVCERASSCVVIFSDVQKWLIVGLACVVNALFSLAATTTTAKEPRQRQARDAQRGRGGRWRRRDLEDARGDAT